MKRALIIVDVQNDFCPGGTLPITHGDEIVPIINKIMAERKFDAIIASMDWHPKGHCDFIDWPAHCIQNTKGAEIHADLELWKYEYIIVQKGNQKDLDSKSAFIANDGKTETGLGTALKGFDEVYICGLALDYCVLQTARDAKQVYGFKTYILLDATRPVHIPLKDILEVMNEMDVIPIYSNEIPIN
jgi:nicotinamidase/pyrazinamidase